MSKQNSTRENFEDVYLRSKCFARTLASLTNEQVTGHLKSPEFNRCVTHASRVVFVKNKTKLIGCGFDEDDVRSITSIYGLEFMASSKPKIKQTRDLYLLMLRSISQRWTNFFIRLDIKFFNNERLTESHIGKLSQGSRFGGDSWDGTIPATSEHLLGREDKALAAIVDGQVNISESCSYKEQVSILKEQLLDFKVTYRKIIDKTYEPVSENENVILTRRKLLRQIRAIKARLSAIRSRLAEERRLLKSLKNELKNNTDKYSERLAFLATSKHSSIDVRKNAQKLCKKHAINYISWAQKHIETKDINSEHFISLK